MRDLSLALYFFLTIYTHCIYNIYIYIYLPAIQETPVQFLGQEDPLEKE